jgi:hypothetical protein
MSDPRPIDRRLKDPGSPDPSLGRPAAEEIARGAGRAARSAVEKVRGFSDRVLGSLPEDLRSIRQWDRAKMLKEGKELSQVLSRQILNRIPGVSAVAGLIVGAWVASTFTTSPIRATLARWGLMEGGRHVVSGPMYKFLSVVLPLLVAAVAAYVVQKVMKNHREQRMQQDIVEVSKLGKDVQAVVNENLGILEKARDAGLLSPGEYLTKKANLYATFSRPLSPQIRDLLISKLG